MPLVGKKSVSSGILVVISSTFHICDMQMAICSWSACDMVYTHSLHWHTYGVETLEPKFSQLADIENPVIDYKIRFLFALLTFLMSSKKLLKYKRKAYPVISRFWYGCN